MADPTYYCDGEEVRPHWVAPPPKLRVAFNRNILGMEQLVGFSFSIPDVDVRVNDQLNEVRELLDVLSDNPSRLTPEVALSILLKIENAGRQTQKEELAEVKHRLSVLETAASELLEFFPANHPEVPIPILLKQFAMFFEQSQKTEEGWKN